LRQVTHMPQTSDVLSELKRLKVQIYFYNIVGSAEHINIPKLEDALHKEFPTSDARNIQKQVMLMQTEGRIRVEEKAKVWIKQPPTPVS
jgi:hypothetical protein